MVVVNVAHDAGMDGGVNLGLRLGLEDHHGHNFSSILHVVTCKEIRSKDLHKHPCRTRMLLMPPSHLNLTCK